MSAKKPKINGHHENPSSQASESFIKALKKDFSSKAVEILATKLPEKIIALSKLHSEEFCLNLKDIASKETGVSLPSVEALVKAQLLLGSSQNSDEEKENFSPGKKRKYSALGNDRAPLSKEDIKIILDAKVISNSKFIELAEKMRTELYEIMEMVNTVKTNFQLKVPQMEDGNNFGVAVQEEAISELGKAEEAIFVAMESVTKYLTHRGLIVSRLVRNPLVEDYRYALKECDRQNIYRMRVTVADLRNNLLVVTDMISKNSSKLINPKGSSSSYGSTMY